MKGVPLKNVDITNIVNMLGHIDTWIK
jgi:hypothetical protein